jgi:tetratricopeptide (TPR) repeat protein
MSLRLALLLLLATVSFAQNTNDGQVSGTVYFKDGQPADHIQVHLQGTRGGVETEATTDTQGKFSFNSLFRRDVYELSIAVRGYQAYSNHYDLSIMGRSFDSITLLPLASTEARNVPPEGPRSMVDARLAQMPPQAKVELDDGIKRSAAHDPMAALEHYRKAIELFPNFAEVYILVGGVHLEQGNLALAEEAFAKAIAIESRLANAQLALGLTRNLMGRTREAEPPLQRAVELDPKNPDAQFELAKNQFALQKFPDAEVHAEKSLQLKPQNPPVYVVLGYSLLRQKKGVEAEEAFQRFLQLAPTSPMAGDIRQVVAMIEQHEKQTRQR